MNAGSSVNLTGSYTTPNPKDTYSLLVSWGDGTTSTVPTSYFSSHTFVASHLFADSAPGTLLSLDGHPRHRHRLGEPPPARAT